MRKSNSVFKTAFVSESGAEISNNDYFAYVEFDDYACYVLAAGITDFDSSEAAKEVVEHLILSFEEKPSMDKTSLLQYMKETNQRLLSGIHARRLKASVIMLVTDYEKFRYVAAGNVRLRMYRKGRFFLKSEDMSLANDMIERGESETPLDRHEERHNLYAYLGKKDSFYPFVSKVQKLDDADILALYSQGLWENVDEQEIDEIFSEASDKPQESVDLLEEMLLSRQPTNLKSYTIVAIFVNKIYRDPDSERKRLRYIKIAIIVAVILIVAAIVFYIFHRIHQNKVATLRENITQTQEFIQAENFVRAQKTCQDALILAQELNLPEEESELKQNLIILDLLIRARDFFINKDYSSAYDDYLKAAEYSNGYGKNFQTYIHRRLNVIENHLDMQQFMELGDDLFKNANYDEAEAVYLKALGRALTVHDNDGREKIMAAIENIYDKRAEIRKDAEQKLLERKKAAMTDLLKKGDDLLAAGDLDGAQRAYLDARNLSDNLAEQSQISSALGNVTDARNKKFDDAKASDETRRKQFLNDALKKGDDLLAAGDLDGAEKSYLDARNLTDNLDEKMATTAALDKVVAAREKKIQEEKISAEERQKRYDGALKSEQKGDESFESGDYLSAQMYYMTAIEQFMDLNEAPKVKSLQAKFDAAQQKDADSRSQKSEAENAETQARNFYLDKNYTAAKAAATQAKEIYAAQGLKTKVDEMDILLQQISVDAVISDAVK